MLQYRDSDRNQDQTLWAKQKRATVSKSAETAEKRIQIPPPRPHPRLWQE